MLIFDQATFTPIERTENTSDGHEASVLGLYLGPYAKFSSEMFFFRKFLTVWVENSPLEVSFQYFPIWFKRKASSFVNFKHKTNFLSIRECHYTFRTEINR